MKSVKNDKYIIKASKATWLYYNNACSVPIRNNFNFLLWLIGCTRGRVWL